MSKEKELREAIEFAKTKWKLINPALPCNADGVVVRPLSDDEDKWFKDDKHPTDEELVAYQQMIEHSSSPLINKEVNKLCRICKKPQGKTPEELAEMHKLIAFSYCHCILEVREVELPEREEKKFTDYFK